MKSRLCRHLQLPFIFDETELLEDLKIAEKFRWKNHFNENGYHGDWVVISLLSVSGNSEDIQAYDQSNAEAQDTDLLNLCPYFKQVIDTFECKKLNARLMKLEPGAYIKPHTDFDLGYEDGNFRIHIPIETNDQVSFVLDGDHLMMLPGECWYTNVNFEHSVRNDGLASRVHLVMDLERNKWSDNLFFSRAPKQNFMKPETKHDDHTTRSIIENLKMMDEDGNKDLIAELQSQLNE
ncbi:MAG: aspartyl/asparaginyl beta-hydroxylase domain-containing protein [Nonlabens sp.]